MNKDYSDILWLPHHTSETHPRMPGLHRAAQFSPFAALTGYEGAVRERGRITEEWRELDECVKVMLDQKIQFLREKLRGGFSREEHDSSVIDSPAMDDELPSVTITYFKSDLQKEGGAYCVVTGSVIKIDEYKKEIILQNHEVIAIEQICGLDGNIFRELEEGV